MADLFMSAIVWYKAQALGCLNKNLGAPRGPGGSKHQVDQGNPQGDFYLEKDGDQHQVHLEDQDFH